MISLRQQRNPRGLISDFLTWKTHTRTFLLLKPVRVEVPTIWSQLIPDWFTCYISFLLHIITNLVAWNTHAYYFTVPEIRSEEWVSRTVLFLEILGKNPFACLSQLLAASHIPWLMALHHSYLKFLSSSLLFWFWFSFSFLPGPLWLYGAHWISLQQPFLPGKITYPRVWGMRD